MNSRKLLVGCGIVITLVLGVVLIGIIASYLFPKQASSGEFPVVVNINLPLNGAELPLNEPVSIYAEAVSDQPVHDLELWLDGAFSPTKMDSSPVDKSPLSATWLWTPAEEGAHRLMVRAIGPNGEAVNSNVVRISVLPREQIADLQITDVPVELQSPLPTPTGEPAYQPPAGPTETPPPPPFPPPGQPQDPAEPPVGAPGLQGSINQCDAALSIQDNAKKEKGFYLYRLDPTSADFTRVATLDKYPNTGNFSYIDPGLSLGNHTYYIASFDGNGEYASNPINLKVTAAQCAAASPQAIGLKDAILTTTKAVDKVYCYLSVNQGPWERKPPGSKKFIYPTNGKFDLGDYLDNLISPPPPGGVTLELECWGWSGNTLVYLGYLKQVVGVGPATLTGTDFVVIGDLAIGDMEGFVSIPSPNIAPPRFVKYAQDLNDCISHTNGVFSNLVAKILCNFTKSGYSVLTWQWTPGCFPPDPNCPYTVDDIEGYTVYKVPQGSDPHLVNVVTNPKLTMGLLPPPGGVTPPQYFVRAYKGAEESKDSTYIDGEIPKYTVTLTNPKLWEGKESKYKCEGALCQFPDTGPNYTVNTSNSGLIRVGFNYDDNDGGTFHEWFSYFRNGHVVFEDLTPIKGEVTSAILRFKWGGGGYCKGVGCNYWVCGIPLVDQYDANIAPAPLVKVEYDVTTMVHSWVQGTPNGGFVFKSGNHNLDWSDGLACMKEFKDFELEVSYK